MTLSRALKKIGLSKVMATKIIRDSGPPRNAKEAAGLAEPGSRECA
jgi:hypothetical protein